MYTLNLDTLVVDYTDAGPVCVRLPTDPPRESSLNPILETVLLESAELSALCEDAECEPGELNFDDDA